MYMYIIYTCIHTHSHMWWGYDGAVFIKEDNYGTTPFMTQMFSLVTTGKHKR